jgi:hypothetical protein
VTVPALVSRYTVKMAGIFCRLACLALRRQCERGESTLS